jgi:hypothetical protein
MKTPHALLAASLVACLGGHRVSLAQDDPAKPAPVQEKPVEKPAAPPAEAKLAADPAADAASDKKARAILAKAAERQNAGDLVEPGKLQSFHVSFHKASVERTKVDKEGHETTTLIEADDDGLVVDWMLGSIKTQFTLNEETTTKAWYQPMKLGWVSDGKTTSSLLGADRKTDYDQLMFQRQVIDRLLDAVILGKLLAADARWRVIEGDATYPATVAIERVATPTAPSLKLWIDHPTKDQFGDVVHAAMPSIENEGTTLIFDFTYDDKLMEGRVLRRGDDGAVAPTPMRFPFKVETFELDAGQKKPRKVLEVFDGTASLNTVVDSDFAQPKPKPKPKDTK